MPTGRLIIKCLFCDVKGEVQTACAIYLVAGHVLGLSDEEGQMLVEAYLDQLDRRRLSGVAASIRRNYAGTQSQTLVRRFVLPKLFALTQANLYSRRRSFKAAAVDVVNLLNSRVIPQLGSANLVKLL
jgi:hypothetical protein